MSNKKLGDGYYFSMGTYDDIPVVMIFSKEVFDSENYLAYNVSDEDDDDIFELPSRVRGINGELLENFWELSGSVTQEKLIEALENEGFIHNLQVEEEAKDGFDSWRSE